MACPANIALLAVALLVVASAPAHAFPFHDPDTQPGGTLNDASAPAAWLPPVAKAWMSELPDSSDIRTLSIPGTHDSAADFGGVLCETNSWSLPVQLRAGIRYLDIRARRNGNDFTIHHGFCFLNMTYADVAREVGDFLKANPRETVVMRLKEEFVPANGSRSFAAIWARYLAQNPTLYVPASSTIPRLGAMRGKVLVLRNADFGDKPVGISYEGPLTNIQDSFRVYLVDRDNPFGADTVSLRQKVRVVIAQLARARAADTLYLNYLSGATGMLPKDVARVTNRAAYEALGPHSGQKTTGVVIMDYPGERLIYRVLRANFASAAGPPAQARGCAARAWRVESAYTFAEVRLPASAIGRDISVRAGAFGIFRFPRFSRVFWTDLKFSCARDGQWALQGRLDYDARCCSFNTRQTYLAVGTKAGSGFWTFLTLGR